MEAWCTRIKWWRVGGVGGVGGLPSQLDVMVKALNKCSMPSAVPHGQSLSIGDVSQYPPSKIQGNFIRFEASFARLKKAEGLGGSSFLFDFSLLFFFLVFCSLVKKPTEKNDLLSNYSAPSCAPLLPKVPGAPNPRASPESPWSAQAQIIPTQECPQTSENAPRAFWNPTSK